MGVGAWVDGVASALLPDACVTCDQVLAEGEGAGVFCAACAHEVIELTEGGGCRRCAEPQVSGQLCGRCRHEAPLFEYACAPFEHEGAVARAVHRFKYEDRADLARPLGRLLAERAAAHLPQGSVLVPIPLHVERFKERRFDQAALLAVEVARRSRRRLELDWLSRSRHTTRQVGLDESQREANVAGAFEVASRAAVRGQAVVLIDDVMTTGATMREATRVLLEAGAARVRVLSLSRARKDLGYA
jgi:ComF family protein